MDLNESSSSKPLTKAQQNRIARQKERAQLIRKSKLTTHSKETVSIEKTTIKIGSTRYKDTGGGFLLEETPEKDELPILVTEDLAPIIETDRPTCENCKEIFAKSWLFDSFELKVCDNCKDPEIHVLIPKTDAMDKYLLKDHDFDKRGPPLKYISRKNPHHNRWGEMKLYLQIQVEKRAIEVWGSMEEIERQQELREEKRILSKTKRYNKQMRHLRMNVRSSLYDLTSSASHTHEYGEDTYNSEDDTYTHTCKTCGFEETYEKM